VLCSTCGSETPSDSRFCRMCGDSFLGAPGARSGRGTLANPQQARVVALLAGILLLFGLAYFAYATHRIPKNIRAADVFDRLTKKPHSIPLASREITINQLGYSYLKLQVPAKATSVELHGNFTATGGADNTIEVLVFSENGYASWQKHQDANPFYSSGKVSMGTIAANLPAGVGTYYVVLNNKFSTLAPKTIRMDAELTYYW
jgi:hypothetical protein